MFTPKQRMLNAYKGIKSDRAPVAPEFWYYYPAKVLGVDMIEFERELPFWQSLKTTFEKYSCEGWGIAFPKIFNENLSTKSVLNGYEEIITHNHNGNTFTTKKMYDKAEPSWVTKHLVENVNELPMAIDMLLDMENEFDYNEVIKAHNGVGESYLLEMWTGVPFFDFIAEILGFENAIMYFMDEEEHILEKYRERYTEYQKRFVRKISQNTNFESFMIGCSYSCNSLIGQNMWRQWDKPYLKAIAEEIHKYDKLLHIHFHGRAIETVSDFAEIGIDCVCPFERGPGGDINTLEDLQFVREKLNDKVTFNGNVHTVETLIRGTTDIVRQEVQEIKEAFNGSNRYIIGSGDQVGRETNEENIYAMIEEGKKI
jgi:hypothetical protein